MSKTIVQSIRDHLAIKGVVVNPVTRQLLERAVELLDESPKREQISEESTDEYKL